FLELMGLTCSREDADPARLQIVHCPNYPQLLGADGLQRDRIKTQDRLDALAPIRPDRALEHVAGLSRRGHHCRLHHVNEPAGPGVARTHARRSAGTVTVRRANGGRSSKCPGRSPTKKSSEWLNHTLKRRVETATRTYSQWAETCPEQR